MKKISLIMIGLILIAATVNSQPITAPEIGNGMDQLYKSMDENSKKIDNAITELNKVPMQVQQNIANMSGNLLGGLSFLILSIEFTKLFIKKVNQRRKRKTHEEYIKELEDKQKSIIENTIKRTDEINDKTTLLLEKITNITTLLNPPKTQSNKKPLITGIVIGAIITFIIHIMGVF